MTAQPPSGVPAGGFPINFAAHQVRANVHGARQDFEEMIGQLVRAVRPGVARVVAANPGDWGIDVFVGNLGGVVTVWQSKYFYPEVGKSHQEKIRESFSSVVKNAKNQGFALSQWILCVPSSMDGPTTKWWDNWKRRKEREFGIVIELWDETELRRLLISPDAEWVRRHYYGPSRSARPTVEVVGLAEAEADRLETALFVRQLREAGHTEVMTSKQQFFNAELMAREIVDKGVPAEVAALSSADAVVHSVWEDNFNEACQASEDALLLGLHKAVMSEIRSQHTTLGAGLPGGPVHTCGLMHRVVDSRRAGWVRHWRQIADEHVQADDVLRPDQTTSISEPSVTETS
ncbi:serine/threonine protein kinase [Nocardia vinacea]|uniref:serine/threonine protein kinase n=1 Tax=Nocardia vinacea TaxID=96468 RepID=UPI00157A84C7|nr:serine/threonine protein kinase [Nocardia vinacea]